MQRRLRWVATAAQPGPVLYRDPLGVISPDGVWLAYTEGLHVRARRVAGGPVCELGPAERFVAHLVWLPDSRRLASFGRDPRSGETAWWIHALDGSAARLWPEQSPLRRVRQLAFAADGTSLGVAASAGEGSEIVRLDGAGRVLASTQVPGTWSFPAQSADGRASAGLVQIGGRPRLALPCGVAPGGAAPEAYGPLAFSPDAEVLYCALPNAGGTLDLHARARGGRAEQLTQFARDSWAPSAARDGRVLFKLQDYSACAARLDAEGGAAELLATFQSETPTWHPDGRQIAVTYGSWRRALDDFHYPDIAQSLGVISLDAPLPAAAPSWIAFASPSEDQGMAWSPDGRWIALHTHFGYRASFWLLEP